MKALLTRTATSPLGTLGKLVLEDFECVTTPPSTAASQPWPYIPVTGKTTATTSESAEPASGPPADSGSSAP